MPRKTTWYAPVKRAGDFLLALILFALALPFLLLAAILVKLTSRGPAFYSQTRLGLKGKPFTIHKLRTMAHNCERLSGPKWATARDSRITRIGRILRKTHLDELPQLWNILRGDMSLVGPRPERPEFIPQLEKALPHYSDRLLVRPGLTGLAQVQLPPDTDLESVRRKLAHDLYYVRNCSPWLDFRVFLGTVFYLLRVPGRVSRAILRLPGGERLERDYQRLAGKVKPIPQVQPA